MKILLAGRNHSQGLKKSDNTSIASVASRLGFEIVASLSQGPDRILIVDLDRRSIKMVRQARKSNIPSSLIMNEPVVVIPQHGHKKILAQFDRLIEVGRPARRIYPWPQTWRNLDLSSERLDKAVLINADKWSFIPENLYWLRSGVASSRSDLEVYGTGWDSSNFRRIMHRGVDALRALLGISVLSFEGVRYILSRPRSYMGLSSDKVATMSRYKVALVIENSRELMTEKLFDAWFAGCIPVYVGPELSKFGLPGELAVEVEPNIEAVLGGLSRAYSIDHADYLMKLKEFLDAESTFASWAAEHALQTIISEAAN